MIKRYVADRDTSIYNAYEQNLLDRAYTANVGASDILDVFSIYAQASSSSVEKARTLVKFPVSNIVADRSNGVIPAAGSVNFYMRLYNAPHSKTLPREYMLMINPITRDWEEGIGLDHETYLDEDAANWYTASDGPTVLWSVTGSDYSTAIEFSQSFDLGYEDLSVDITSLVESWVDGSVSNYGVVVRLTGSQENAIDEQSYYIKEFFARKTEYWFKRPCIEARWDGSISDDRGRFFASSSIVPAADNVNSIYLYNYVRGRLVNFPVSDVFVDLYSSSAGGTKLNTNFFTASNISTGVYSASVFLETTASVIYDRWYSGSLALHTGSLKVNQFSAYEYNPYAKYVTNIRNLKNYYRSDEVTRFRLYTRQRNWQPTIYSVASDTAEIEVVDNAYYRIYRVADNYDVLGYGTGSVEYTRLSYDEEGNYFDFDMDLLEPGYMYGIRLAYKIDTRYVEQPDHFKFKVIEAE